MSARNLAQTLPDLSDPFVGPHSRQEEGFSLLGDSNPLVSRAGFSEWPAVSPKAAHLGVTPSESDAVPELTVETETAEFDSPSIEIANDPQHAVVDGIKRQHLEEIERLRGEHAEQIESLRQEMADREIAELSLRIADIEGGALRQLEARVADALGQVFGDIIAEQSVEMLCKWLKARVQQPGAILIELKGPKALTEKVTAKLGDATEQVRITDAESLDLYVEIDGEVLATRLGEWRMMIEDCLS